MQKVDLLNFSSSHSFILALFSGMQGKGSSVITGTSSRQVFPLDGLHVEQSFPGVGCGADCEVGSLEMAWLEATSDTDEFPAHPGVGKSLDNIPRLSMVLYDR